MTPPEHAVVTTTTDTEAKARSLAAEIIDAQLAACAQIHPVSSVYRWEGKVEQAQEWRVDFKTRTALVPALSDRVVALHDYDTPEVVAVPVVGGSAAYLTWVTAETGG